MEAAVIYEVSEAEFEPRVVERSHEVPVVVDFWAEWCGPCRQLGPALESAVRARQGKVELAKVDVDRNQMLARAFGVQGIPAVKAFRDGKVAGEFTGAVPPARIEQFLDSLLPTPADEFAEAGDEASLRAALAEDPRHSGAAVALGRLLVERDEADEARELLADHVGDFVASGLLARLELRADAEQNGDQARDGLVRAFDAWDAADHATALELLQAEVASSADPERRDLLRRVMVAIFTDLGPADSLASEHRRRLAAALS